MSGEISKRSVQMDQNPWTSMQKYDSESTSYGLATSITFDVKDAEGNYKSGSQKINLGTADITSFSISNMVEDDRFFFIFIQDGTGGTTVLTELCLL